MQDDRHHHEMDNSLDELRDLLADFTTGELTESQNARLEQLVLASQVNRRFYIQYLHMYGTIHQEHCNGGEVQTTTIPWGDGTASEKQADPFASGDSVFSLLDMEKDLLSSCSDIDAFGASKTPDPSDAGPGGFFGSINFSFVPGLITIVSAVLILSVVVVLPIYWSTRSKELAWDIVARVSHTVDCQWEQNSLKPTTGSFLATGQKLELELGLAELEFASGARVVLEGPAEFTIVGNNASNLALGRLAATVPEGAQGFTVETPNLEVIDLGTEFGVEVDEDGSTDVHVFKGLVETKITNPAAPVKNKRKRLQPSPLRLKKEQAAQYTKVSDDIFPIPINKKKFVRNLDRNGVTANLMIVNPSFESPNIRVTSEFQKAQGNTRFRPIYGWNVSDHNRDKTLAAMYQISPYRSSITNSNVGPDATDGQQVATISLGVKPSKVAGPRSNWIYQSLGMITSSDLGKTLRLSVDAGPRSAYGGFPQGNGMVIAGFATRVSPEKSGVIVGTPDSFQQGKNKIQELHRLEAILPITSDLLGQELFVLLAASDDGSSQNRDQYFFDNVEIAVQE